MESFKCFFLPVVPGAGTGSAGLSDAGLYPGKGRIGVRGGFYRFVS